MRKADAVRGVPTHVLVSAPNRAGELFLRRLRQRGVPHVAMVNNQSGKERLESLGISPVLVVDTRDKATWRPPDVPIGKVFLFEDSMNLSCRYIQICQTWQTGSIHAVTRSDNSRGIYRALGAKHVKYETKRDIPELLRSML